MLTFNRGEGGGYCDGQWGGGGGGGGKLKDVVLYDRIEPHNKVQV